MEREVSKKKALSAGQKRKQRIRHRAWLRAGIQILFFLTMPGAFVAGFSGVKYLFQWIGAGDVLQLNSFTKALLGLVLFTILFGRYFCGYICAFGSTGDFVYWISGLVQTKLFHKKKPCQLPQKVVSLLQKLKYIILALIVILCAFGLYGHLSGSSPWDVFSRLTAFQAVPKGYFWGILLLVLVVIGMAFQERFFCQFLCPMGAVFAILPVLPWAMLKRNSSNCIRGCNACANQCPVRLKLEADGIRNGECIACEKCVPTCPKGNITRIEWRLLRHEMIPVVIKAVLFFIMGVYLGFLRFL